MNAALPLPPQARPVSERLAAVLRAVRNLAPAPLKIGERDVVTVAPERSAAWAALVAHLQAYALLASIPADSALSGVPRDLRAAHALWSEVRDATTARLTQEAAGHARTRSGLTALLLESRTAAAATARAVDSLFEALTEGRL